MVGLSSWIVSLVLVLQLFLLVLNGQRTSSCRDQASSLRCRYWKRNYDYCSHLNSQRDCFKTCHGCQQNPAVLPPNSGSTTSDGNTEPSSCATNSLSESAKQNFAESSSGFAWDLYLASRELDSLKNRLQNVFLSPTSISVALGMALAGARQQTRDEILQSTRLDGVPDAEVDAAYAWLLQELNSGGKEYELHTANSVYIQNSLNLLQEYSQTLSSCFRSPPELRDFKNRYELVRQEINQWVANQTRNKILDLLPSGSVKSLTQMVLVNAIYFKGQWLRPFTKKNGGRTFTGQFYPVPDHKFQNGVDAEMMSMKSRFLYSDDDSDFDTLGISYKGEELTMFIFLPKSRRLQDLEAGLSGARLRQMMSSVEKRQVDVSLPKFNLTRDLPLKRVLRRVGMQEMWTDSADFSRMTGTSQLKVDNAFHKAFIEVNEKGTEAAAATGLVVVPLSAQIHPNPKFTADHPFLFLIRHTSSQSILFIGSLYDVSHQ